MFIEKLQEKFKHAESSVKKWVSEQSPPVEVAIVTIASAAQGGFIGGLMGTMTKDVSANLPQTGPATPETEAAMSNLKAIGGSPLAQARNFAVMTGVNAGITAAMKRARGGVEDLQSSAAAAFGSGFAFSLVSGMGGPNQLSSAFSTGFAFAVFQGGLYKVSKMFAEKPSDSYLYTNTRGMLVDLGLQKYEKNFKKGLLTDETLPLITDSALKDINIPPGPRLLILDHVHKTVKQSR